MNKQLVKHYQIITTGMPEKHSPASFISYIEIKKSPKLLRSDHCYQMYHKIVLKNSANGPINAIHHIKK